MLLMPRRNQSMRLFEELFRDPILREATEKPIMKTDLREKETEYVMDIDLPGFQKENIDAELHKGYLTIRAQKDTAGEEKKEGNYIHRERYMGQCARSFYVGEGVTEEDIKASYSEGILSLTIPKEETKKVEEQKKLISIQ